MRSTWLEPPAEVDLTLSYHENESRDLVPTRLRDAGLVSPAGGLIHSTVQDMSLWMELNLGTRKDGPRVGITQETLRDIHCPQILCGGDTAAPSAHAAYAMGWFVDWYNGHRRLSHGGYLHDINSEVSLFPDDGIGVVSFTNHGCARLARLINQYAFDLTTGLKTTITFDDRIAQYERDIEAARARKVSTARVLNTKPSHSLGSYAGSYQHLGYGTVLIDLCGDELIFRREKWEVALQHWHYDVWVAQDSDDFAIHGPHLFERSNGILFENDLEGGISGLYLRVDPALPAARFVKRSIPG
jgi:hypothetical protein